MATFQLFGRKTVAGVLSVFNKTLDDLKQVEIENQAEASRQAQIIVEANAAHDAAIAEVASAREVAEKLSNLISPTLATISIAELEAENA